MYFEACTCAWPTNSRLHWKPNSDSPLARSAAVVAPARLVSVQSVAPQLAVGTGLSTYGSPPTPPTPYLNGLPATPAPIAIAGKSVTRDVSPAILRQTDTRFDAIVVPP